MAQFDPSIISSIPDSAPNIVRAEERALSLKDMMDTNQLRGLQVGAAKKEAQESGEVEKILKGSDYSTPEGLATTVAKVNKVSPKSAMGLLKEGQAYQSGQVQAQIDQLTLADKRQELIVSAIDPIVSQARQMKNSGASELEVKAFISQQMPQVLQGLRTMKLPDGKPALPDDQLKMATEIPGGYTLPVLEGWESKSKAGQAAIRQRLEQFKGDTAEKREQETERHNQAMEGLAGKKAAATSGAGEFGGPVGDVLGAMADIGIALPTGLRAKAQMVGTIQALVRRHPNDSADQIAQRVKSGQIGTGAAKTEANVVARREGSAAAAINALNRDGGLYDQLTDTAKKVDFGSAKFANALKLWNAGQVVADPDISEYVNALADTRAEFASVLARGGQVTDSVRIAAEHAFPDKMSLAELTRAVSRSKQIAESIQAGNTDVADSIIAGKSLTDTTKATSPGAGAAPGQFPAAKGAANAPGGAAKSQLTPGNTYQHASGATVQILPDDQ